MITTRVDSEQIWTTFCRYIFLYLSGDCTMTIICLSIIVAQYNATLFCITLFIVQYNAGCAYNFLLGLETKA